MKFLSFIIYPILTLSLSSSCFTMEVLHPDSFKLEDSGKRLRPEELQKGDRGYRGKKDISSKKRRDQKGESVIVNRVEIDEQEINKRLIYKAGVLVAVLPNVSESLNAIVKELGEEGRAKRDHDFEGSSELARIGSFAMSLRHSTEVILRNLASLKGDKKKGISPNVGLAICGSGALKDHINQLIKTLENYESTKKINCDILKSAIEEIQTVTSDIDVGGFTLSDKVD